jgi:hypothetical protein
LNSLVNILLDNPMTHSPFQWILSLNRLCQKWGQVQLVALIVRVCWLAMIAGAV